MIAFTQTIIGRDPHLRIVCVYHHPLRTYVSDCYYEENPHGDHVFAGGLFYEVWDGKIVNHVYLLHLLHPEFDASYDLLKEQYGRVFSKELSFCGYPYLTKATLLDGPNLHNQDMFDVLFTPMGVIEKFVTENPVTKYTNMQYRPFIQHEDIGLLFRVFLKNNGWVNYTSFFSGFDQLLDYSEIQPLFQRLITEYWPRECSSPEATQAITSLCSVTLSCDNGRWLIIRIVYFDNAFKTIYDCLDLFPLITMQHDALGDIRDSLV